MLITTLFFFSISVASAEKAKAQPVYNAKQAEAIKAKVSRDHLIKMFKQKGVDAANDVFFDVVTDFAKKAKKLSADSNGFKLIQDSDKDLLIFIVNSAQSFTNEIESSLIHFYGLSMLYKELPQDFNWAIDRSALGSTEKLIMRDALKAQAADQ